MNLAPLAQLLTSLVQAADNNTALALSDTNETVSHDRFNRIIQTQRLTSVLTTLVLRLALTGGYLILDDTILEKFTARLGCVFKLRDTKRNCYLLGLNIVLLCWSNGKRTIPIGFRIYVAQNVSKLDLAVQLLKFAHDTLKLTPEYVLFDSWYGSEALFKQCQAFNWPFVTRLRKNRLFCGKPLKRVHNGIPYWGSVGFLKGQIPVVVYRHGGKYFASSDLDLTRDEIRGLYSIRTGIEEVFRVLKQECGWQGVQARRVRSYRTQLTAGVLGFFWLESLAKARKCSVYKLRRRLISGRLQLKEVDALEFLEAA
jgi:putative transposase